MPRPMIRGAFLLVGAQLACSGSDGASGQCAPGQLPYAHTATIDLGGDDSDQANGVAELPDGSVFVGGAVRGAVDLGTGVLPASSRTSKGFIAVVEPGGKTRWARRFCDADSVVECETLDVAVDESGVLYVAAIVKGDADLGGGVLAAATTETELVIASYESSGAHRWSQRLGPVRSELNSRAGLVAVKGGGVAITGATAGPVTVRGTTITAKGFVASLDASGSARWVKTLDVGLRIWDIAAFPDGRVVVLADVSGSIDLGGGPRSTVGNAALVAVHDTTGAVTAWFLVDGASSSDIFHPRVVAAHPSGDVFVGGVLQGTIAFGGTDVTAKDKSSVVARARIDGSLVWSRSWGASIAGAGVAAILAEPSGGVAVATVADENADFGAGATKLPPSAGGMLIGGGASSVVRLDEAGRHQWTFPMGFAARISAIHSGTSGVRWLAGHRVNSIYMGACPLPAPTKPPQATAIGLTW